MTIEDAKRVAGQKAASFIEEGMIVGLGTGSTAEWFVRALAERVQKEKLRVQTVASSHASAVLGRSLGLHVVELNDVPRVDITVDGADEIDPKKRMIKGGGGAHVREKILAASSGEMIVVVDETKLVKQLGKAKLPIEVLLYGSPATRSKLEQAGYPGKWRTHEDGTLFVTENGNLLFDVVFPKLPQFPEEDHALITQIPGVVDTGFFFDLAGRVVVGYLDGMTDVRK